MLVYFLVLYYLPLVLSLREAMSGAQPLSSFYFLFHDKLFATSLRNAAVFSGLSMVLIITGGFTLAIWINGLKNNTVKACITLMVLVPTFIPLTATSFMWWWIYHPKFGFANYMLKLLGLPELLYVSSPKQALLSLVVINVWARLGFATTLILAGLQGVPKELYEAALVDGAKGIKLHFSITLPLVLPYILVAALLEIIQGVKVFDIVYVITQGGPAMSTYVPMLYIYDYAFRMNRPDVASAAAVVTFVILLLFGLLQRYISRKAESWA